MMDLTKILQKREAYNHYINCNPQRDCKGKTNGGKG